MRASSQTIFKSPCECQLHAQVMIFCELGGQLCLLYTAHRDYSWIRLDQASLADWLKWRIWMNYFSSVYHTNTYTKLWMQFWLSMYFIFSTINCFRWKWKEWSCSCTNSMIWLYSKYTPCIPKFHVHQSMYTTSTVRGCTVYTLLQLARLTNTKTSFWRKKTSWRCFHCWQHSTIHLSADVLLWYPINRYRKVISFILSIVAIDIYTIISQIG